MTAFRPIVYLFLLLIPLTARAAAVYYSTGFETMANGQLAGQDSWTSDIGPAVNVSVQSTVVKTGTKAVVLEMAGSQDFTRAVRIFAAGATSASWDFQLGAGQTGSSLAEYRVTLFSGGLFLMSAQINLDGSVELRGQLGPQATGVTLTPGVWYRMQLDFDFTTSQGTFSVNSVRRLTTPFNPALASIDVVSFTLIPTGPATGQAFIDNLSITDTPEPVATTITVVPTTNNQNATVGTAFANNLQAVVRDQSGNPLPGVGVTFAGGQGTFASNAAVVTDANGVATATTFTASTVAGANAPTATVTGSNPSLSATFALTNVAGAPASLTALGAAQATPVTVGFSNRLQAKVTDQYGNPVSGVTVTFSTGAAGTFSGGSSANTNASGIAQSAPMVAGATAGVFTPTASTASLAAINLPQLTVTPGPATDVNIISGSPQSRPVFTSFAPLIVVAVDTYGNPVPNAPVFFASPVVTQATALFSNASTGIQVQTGPNGQASTTPVANGIVGSYQVTATILFDGPPPVARRAPGAAPRRANVVNFALQNLTNPIAVTVVTNITGPTVTANATTFTGTRTFTGVYNQGDPFTITTTSPQAFSGGQSQYVFLSGPNGASTTQSLTLPFASTVTYTMNFKAQHQVTFNTAPPAGGTINPVGTAFYDQGTVLNVQATANANFVFAGFTGLLGGATSPQALTVAGPGVVTANFIPGDSYQIRYMSNLNLGDSVINITNTGARGAGLAAGTTANTTGAFCANVYAFSPDEQMVSCCSCPVTPNGLVSLSARGDLISNTLTPAVPTSIVVKLLASIPDTTAGCNNSAATVGVANLAPGLLAWGTTVKADAAGAQLVETRFLPATLSIGNGGANVGELGRLQQLCSFINANGSGFGVCRSCRLGGLGAGRQ